MPKMILGEDNVWTVKLGRKRIRTRSRMRALAAAERLLREKERWTA